MPEKIGDLVDRRSLPDELGGKAVAQEMCTCDPPVGPGQREAELTDL
ncbi:hypothetical protein X735_32710 [Mesorhizobium sp. L2C085B000]|nr:hypothetical protein X735_32710 [Mesorhizobium sp. L2C085B000]